MTVLDLLIVLLLVSAIVGGYRLGFLARITSWAGLALGVFAGANFLPEVAEYFEGSDPAVRVLAVIAFLLAAGMLGQGLGLALGAALHATLPVGLGFRQYDRAAGAGLGALGVLVIFWLLAPSMAHVEGWVARATRDSAVLAFIDDVAPRPPDTFQTLRHLLADSFGPNVFDPFDRSTKAAGRPPAESGIPLRVHRTVVASTVKVTGQACSKVQEGSGFVIAPDLVMTNAHVVAGEDDTRVIRNGDDDTLDGEVVAFDPGRDLAVILVPGMGRPALPLADGGEGARGAVYGHPGGGTLEVSPAQVSQRVRAVGRDIYDANRTERDVFVLASNLKPGDSGGAFVDTTGKVLGVAFAIAPDDANTAYALTSNEARPVLESAARGQTVDTGPCLV